MQSIGNVPMDQWTRHPNVNANKAESCSSWRSSWRWRGWRWEWGWGWSWSSYMVDGLCHSACSLIRYCCQCHCHCCSILWLLLQLHLQLHFSCLCMICICICIWICICVLDFWCFVAFYLTWNVLPLDCHYNMPFAIEFSSTEASNYFRCLQPICIFVCFFMTASIKVSRERLT